MCIIKCWHCPSYMYVYVYITRVHAAVKYLLLFYLSVYSFSVVYNFLLLFYVWVWFLYYYVGIVSEKPLVPCSGHGFDVTITSCHDTSCIATETKTSDIFVFPV